MADLSRKLYAGKFTGKGTLETSEGNFFLSGAADEDHSGSLRAIGFPTALEREGQYALIKAARKGKTLWLCEIIELLDPISSRLLDRLLADMPALRGQLVTLVRDLRDELLGEPVAATDLSDPLRRSASSGPKPICALVVGHRKRARGATGKHGGEKISEWDFNRKLAASVAEQSTLAEVLIVFRDDTSDGYAKLPGKINRLNPKFIVSLHANAADGVAGGTETLYYHTSTQGKKLAGIVQKHLLAALGLSDRKLKQRESRDRGGTLLAGTNAPAVIAEPFFIDNASDLARAISRKEILATEYAAAIDEYAALLSVGPRSAATSRAASRSFGGGSRAAVAAPSLAAGNRTKARFLSDNKAVLLGMIDTVNQMLATQYRDAVVGLSQTDFWVLFNSEAGLRSGGNIDVEHKHSEGERGLLPLPSNVAFWNGSSAPDPNAPMPVETNVHHFMSYLGQLKNKSVRTEDGFTFYRGAFQEPKIRGNVLREARMLSGIVHGYLYFANFSDRKVPVESILNGFAADKSIPAIMDNTTYVHAGKSILVNREKNIQEAVAMV